MKGRLILRITAASIVSGLLLCSPSFSQTVDISSLTEKERTIHRASWCSSITSSISLDSEIEIIKVSNSINAVDRLLYENGFQTRENDPKKIHRKTYNDVNAALIVGDLEVTLEMLTDCSVDMVSILKNEYIPNFSYMNN